jgi:hypothetical protein
MTFIVSSYFIEVLGDEDADLEMPKILGRFGESQKTFFQSIGAKKSKISSKLEVLKTDGAKIVLFENNH